MNGLFRTSKPKLLHATYQQVEGYVSRQSTCKGNEIIPFANCHAVHKQAKTGHYTRWIQSYVQRVHEGCELFECTYWNKVDCCQMAINASGNNRWFLAFNDGDIVPIHVEVCVKATVQIDNEKQTFHLLVVTSCKRTSSRQQKFKQLTGGFPEVGQSTTWKASQTQVIPTGAVVCPCARKVKNDEFHCVAVPRRFYIE